MQVKHHFRKNLHPCTKRCKNCNMVTKESVQKWLDHHRHTRDWLAEKTGVTRRTVDNWLVSPRPIPAKAIPIIQRLMEEDARSEQLASMTPSSLVLHFSKEDFRKIQQAALNKNTVTDEWAERELLALAETNIKKLAEEISADIDPLDSPAIAPTGANLRR